MQSKICSKCKVEKTFNEYSKNSRNKNGLDSSCKDCRNKARRERYRKQSPLERQIVNTATSILHRTKGRSNRKRYFDKGIQCLIGNNLAEVTNYLRENFSEDIQTMLDKGEQVSIDRIDSSGHYEDGNIRIMEFRENSLRGAVSGGKASLEMFGHTLLIKDLETGSITRAPSKKAAAEIIGCSNCSTIRGYLKRNNPSPIFGRYTITRESE